MQVCTSKRKKKILEMYSEGKSVEYISHHFSMTILKVKSLLYRDRVAQNKTRNKHIIAMYKEGVKQREIAEKYGITTQAISSIIHNRGEAFKKHKTY